MTLKAFEELVRDKSESEYMEWFDKMAGHEICIGTVYIRCVKLSKTRVAFRDASVYKVQQGNVIRDFDVEADKEKQRLIRIYDGLDVVNRIALRSYLDLLAVKDDMERSLKNKTDSADGAIKCSFCGKPQGEVQRLVSAPNHVFICDDCIDICYEIMQEELEDDERFRKPSDEADH